MSELRRFPAYKIRRSRRERRRRALRRLAITAMLSVAAVTTSLWAIPGNLFGGFYVIEKGEKPAILVQSTNRSFGADNIYAFRLNYLAGPDCFVADGLDGDLNYRAPIIWPPGSRVHREDGRLGVSVPNGGMIWSSFTRTTFWVGDAVQASGSDSLFEANRAIPVVDNSCRGAEMGPSDYTVPDPGELSHYKPRPPLVLPFSY